MPFNPRAELDTHAVEVAEAEDGLAEAGFKMLDGDARRLETVLPIRERGGGDAEGCGGGFAYSDAGAGGAGPREEGQDGARGAEIVTEVEVVAAGIVEVDGALDEAEAEQFGIEVESALRIRGDGGDVMKSDDW